MEGHSHQVELANFWFLAVGALRLFPLSSPPHQLLGEHGAHQKDLKVLGIFLYVGPCLPAKARSEGCCDWRQDREVVCPGALVNQKLPGEHAWSCEAHPRAGHMLAAPRGRHMLCLHRLYHTSLLGEDVSFGTGARWQGQHGRGLSATRLALCHLWPSHTPVAPRAHAAEIPSAGCRCISAGSRDKPAPVSYFLCCWKSPKRREGIMNSAGKMLMNTGCRSH